MHWLETILNETGLTRYRMSMLTNISEAQLASLIKNNTPKENVKHGQVVKILELAAVMNFLKTLDDLDDPAYSVVVETGFTAFQYNVFVQLLSAKFGKLEYTRITEKDQASYYVLYDESEPDDQERTIELHVLKQDDWIAQEIRFEQAK